MPVNYDAPIEVRDGRNGNWFWVDKEIWSDDRLTSSDKVLYGTLAFFSNQKSQKSFPSITTLQHHSKLSKRQIYVSLKNLEKCLHILIERHYGKPNQYILIDNGINHLKSDGAKSAPVQNNTQVGVQNEETNKSYINKKLTKVSIATPTGERLIAGNIRRKTGNCPNKIEGHKGCIEYIQSVAKDKGHKFINVGKQIKFLHQILRAGFTFDDMDNAIDHLEKSKFYMENGWDFANVAQYLERN